MTRSSAALVESRKFTLVEIRFSIQLRYKNATGQVAGNFMQTAPSRKMSLRCTPLEMGYPLENGSTFLEPDVYFTVAFIPGEEKPRFRLDNHPVRRSCGKESSCVHMPLTISEMRFLQFHQTDSATCHKGDMTVAYEFCTLIINKRVKRNGDNAEQIVEMILTCQEHESLRHVISDVCEDIDMMSLYLRRKDGNGKLHAMNNPQALQRLALAHAHDVRERNYGLKKHEYSVDASSLKSFLHSNGLTVARGVVLKDVIKSIEKIDIKNVFLRSYVTPTGALFIHNARCNLCSCESFVEEEDKEEDTEMEEEEEEEEEEEDDDAETGYEADKPSAVLTVRDGIGSSNVKINDDTVTSTTTTTNTSIVSDSTDDDGCVSDGRWNGCDSGPPSGNVESTSYREL